MNSPTKSLPFEVIEDGKQTRLVFKMGFLGRAASAGFMMIWLTIWTAGCVALLSQIILDFDWFMVLFGLPFFAAWFAGVAVLIHSLFGKRILIIDSDALESKSQVIFTFNRRRIPFKELVGFEIAEGDEGLHSLLLITVGQALNIHTSNSENELEKVERFLCSAIPTLERQSSKHRQQPSTGLEARKQKPSDCEWSVEPAFGDQTVFSNRGHFSLGGTFGLLFVNLFWNGIVSVFLFAPFSEAGGDAFPAFAMVFLYIFLIPFVLVGLLMFCGLIQQLLEPVRKTTWEFSDREISRTLRYFGIPFRKAWPLMLKTSMRLVNLTSEEKEDSVDPFTDPPLRKTRKFFSMQRTNNGEQSKIYGIDFIESKKIVTTWEGLTKGDADWITTTLEKEQASYSPF